MLHVVTVHAESMWFSVKANSVKGSFMLGVTSLDPELRLLSSDHEPKSKKILRGRAKNPSFERQISVKGSFTLGVFSLDSRAEDVLMLDHNPHFRNYSEGGSKEPKVGKASQKG